MFFSDLEGESGIEPNSRRLHQIPKGELISVRLFYCLFLRASGSRLTLMAGCRPLILFKACKQAHSQLSNGHGINQGIVGANSFALPINAGVGLNVHGKQVNSTRPRLNISDNKIHVLFYPELRIKLRFNYFRIFKLMTINRHRALKEREFYNSRK
ncbi:MAG: hypothetical protein M8364_12015 [Methylobacter sp.]|uniref:hypothetical protein n=1 Tax=Methylobacter sp. TaxID=2051955 RepID=UPI00258677B5|nr:hypothetical protein [Methylobacter sp.]MCL7421618.1 hypothetical protein [Methylobacter sp.]